jgi:ankyrin repeat protein
MLRWALQRAQKSTLIYLLDAKVDIQDLGRRPSAFHHVIGRYEVDYPHRNSSLGDRSKERMEIIRLLVERGLDVNTIDWVVRTPLSLATEQADESIF